MGTKLSRLAYSHLNKLRTSLVTLNFLQSTGLLGRSFVLLGTMGGLETSS